VIQYVSDAIKKTYEANCPERLKHPLTKVLWSKELSKRRSEVRKLFNKARRKNLTADWEAYRQTQHCYSKTTTIAKRKSWRKFYESIENAPEASRLNKILSKDNSSRLDCLTLPNGNYTETTDETFKHLMSTHFSGFQEEYLLYPPRN